MAIKKTIELDVKSNIKSADKDLKEIKSGLKDIKQQAEKTFAADDVKKLNKEMGNTTKVAVDVRQKLRDIQNKMAEIGDVGSAEFQALAAEAGKYKDQMNNANAAIKSMSADFPKLQLGVQALGALGAAAGAATAGMALFGSENEEAAKAIQRMMAITTLMSSVTQVSNMLGDESALGLKVRTMLTKLKTGADKKSTTALFLQAAGQKAVNIAQKAGAIGMKVLNAVMNLNPIFLIITGVIALVAAFKMLSGSNETAVEDSKKLNKTLEEQDRLMEKANANREREHAQKMRRLDIEEASERDRLAAVLGNLDKEQESRKEDLKNTKQALKDLRVVKEQAREEENWELAKEIADQLEAKRKSYNDLVILVKDHKQNVLDTTQEGNKKIDAEENASDNERLSRYKAFLAKKKELENTALSVARELEAGRIELMEAGLEKETETIRNKFLIQREDLLANEKLTQSQKQQLQKLHDTQEEEALNIVHQKKLTDARAKAQELLDAKGVKAFVDLADPTAGLDVEIEAEEIKGQALFDIKKKWNDANQEMLDISASKGFERTAKGLENASSALSSLDSLNTALTEDAVAKAGDNEAAAEAARKKGFERSKKMQIGMAIIQGIQGTMAAFTAGSAMGPAGVVMGPLMAGLAAATSVVNIAKIAKTQYQGGGGGDRAEVSGGVTSVPEFNIAGNSTENQLAQSLGQQEQTPIKAMVVSTEVTTAQSLDRNKIDTATL